MRKIFLMLTVSLFSLEAAATTCTPTPECASLGYKYSLEECENMAVKCPNGDSYYCPSPRPKCNIGDIFYSDNTCVPADKYDSSKTALGVVVYVNPNGIGGQIMASNSGIGKMLWSTKSVDTGLPVYSSSQENEAAQDFDSCGNTKRLIAAGTSEIFPAAWAAKSYTPTSETAGKWCLPAAGIFRNISKNLETIKNSFSKFGGITLVSCAWSSTVCAHIPAWISYFNYGVDGIGYSFYCGDYNAVHPVLEF